MFMFAKMLSVSFVALSLFVANPEATYTRRKAAPPAAKKRTGDCCDRRLACCAEGLACCEAKAKLGCCERDWTAAGRKKAVAVVLRHVA